MNKPNQTITGEGTHAQFEQHLAEPAQAESLNKHVLKYGRHAASRECDILLDEHILLASKIQQSSKEQS